MVPQFILLKDCGALALTSGLIIYYESLSTVNLDLCFLVPIGGKVGIVMSGGMVLSTF